MEERRNAPKLRFPGFTDPWEQRRLGEIGSARSGVGFPNAEQGGSEGTPFYKVSDMNLEGNEFQLRRANNYVTDEQIERKRWKPINEVPAMFFAKVGAAVLLNRKRLVDEPFLLDNNTMAYSFNRRFWDVTFGRILFDGLDLTSLVQVGALPSYNASDIESMEVAIPLKIAEQTKIGALFQRLDSLIALHQRELDHVKELKKGLLQKMFPKEGANVPELRFPGFTDPWEQRRFGELALLRRGLTYTPDDVVDAQQGTRVLRSSNINEDRFELSNDDVFVREDAVNIDLVRNNDILITAANGSSRLVGKRALIKGLTDSAVHGGFMLLASTEEPDFFNAVMGTEWYRRFLRMGVAGGNGALGNLDSNALRNRDLLVPKRAEQKAIGVLFAKLDSLIALHQRELDHVKELKKGLLQQMFV